MRKKLVIGNWKMNTSTEEAINLIVDIKGLLPADKETVLCVPFTHIAIGDELVLDTNIQIGAQNVSAYDNGAYTGEISADMLKSLAVDYVIVGHSERRQLFYESDELVKTKIDKVLAAGMIPVFCCGETLEIRNSGNYLEAVTKQLQNGLFHLRSDWFSKVVVAYEPIWAIGTGETASPEQAQEVHNTLRNSIREKYNDTTADNTTILYGGSVNAINASDLFGQKDIDGGLVGGASLHAEKFVAIINAL